MIPNCQVRTGLFRVLLLVSTLVIGAVLALALGLQTTALSAPGLPAPAGSSPSPLPVASYAIDVALDVEQKTLTGHEIITYTNTTAEPIPDLVFHLYLNAFRDQNSLFLRESGQAHRGFDWSPELAGWIQVANLSLAGATPAPLALHEIEDGTLARAALPVLVAPGTQLVVELDFTAQLPRVFARTGYVDDFYMVGQWFPKLGVWESGAWNAHPFHANSEFYADFGNYDVRLTLPAGYVTGATGLPQSTTENGDGTQTVHYYAVGVIDFAWTACPRFRIAAQQSGGVELLYLYLPEHRWTVRRTMAAASAAMDLYGQWFGPYAYSRLTIVDVPDEGQGAGGMEYPTLITAGTLDLVGGPAGMIIGRASRLLELVVTHEVAHQWWQSTVAFNEAEEPWLDEGLADYATTRAMEAAYGVDTSLLDIAGLRVGALEMRRFDYLSAPQVPMAGRAWEFDAMEYGVAAYAKPVLALRTLERVLGDETMLAVLSEFTRRYRFAHPTAADLRAVAEEVSGRDLAWFFDGLVAGDGVLNYRLAALDAHSVTVARQGDLVLPTELLITFSDGSTLLQPWDGRESQRTFTYPDHPPLRSAIVDPERSLQVDLAWADNGLSRRPEPAAWLALFTRLLYTLQNGLLAWGGL